VLDYNDGIIIYDMEEALLLVLERLMTRNSMHEATIVRETRPTT
jgi:hypothetical protein